MLMSPLKSNKYKWSQQWFVMVSLLDKDKSLEYDDLKQVAKEYAWKWFKSFDIKKNVEKWLGWYIHRVVRNWLLSFAEKYQAKKRDGINTLSLEYKDSDWFTLEEHIPDTSMYYDNLENDLFSRISIEMFITTLKENNCKQEWIDSVEEFLWNKQWKKSTWKHLKDAIDWYKKYITNNWYANWTNLYRDMMTDI